MTSNWNEATDERRSKVRTVSNHPELDLAISGANAVLQNQGVAPRPHTKYVAGVQCLPVSKRSQATLKFPHPYDTRIPDFYRAGRRSVAAWNILASVSGASGRRRALVMAATTPTFRQQLRCLENIPL